MRQYQNLPISTSTSTKKLLSSVPVPVPVLRILSENAAKFQFFERRISFHAGNSNYVEQFWTFLSLKFQFERKNMTCFGKLRCRQFFCLIFCFFLRFGTGTDWLSTCAISTSTESLLENWTSNSTSTSTSTSVRKMISGLKKSVPVPVDWLIYSSDQTQYRFYCMNWTANWRYPTQVSICYSMW